MAKPSNETKPAPATLADVIQKTAKIVDDVKAASLSLKEVEEYSNISDPFRHGIMKRLELHLGEFTTSVSGMVSVIKSDVLAR